MSRLARRPASTRFAPRVEDVKAEERLTAHDRDVASLRALPAASLRVLPGIVLEDGTVKQVAHKLGRAPQLVLCSVPRGPLAAGYIEEVRSTTTDRNTFISLRASGYGAAITVDVGVL